MGPTTAAHAAAIETVAKRARARHCEPDEHSGLIDAIYDAGFDAQRWPDVCVRIADALDALAHGVLIVDADAHIVFANRAATAQLARANGLHTEHAALSTATAAATQQLRALIARAAGRDRRGCMGGAMLIARQPPDEPLQALISPLGAHRRADFAQAARAGTAMLIVIDPQSSRRGVETRLVALFGLTPAEARVACEVGKGRNPKDVAEALQVLPSTVRTHLHHVFAKTATRRQAELMRLIAQLAIARGD